MVDQRVTHGVPMAAVAAMRPPLPGLHPRTHHRPPPPRPQVDDESRSLIKTTHDALMAAVAACRPGARFRDMGDIISRHVNNAG